MARYHYFALFVLADLSLWRDKEIKKILKKIINYVSRIRFMFNVNEVHHMN